MPTVAPAQRLQAKLAAGQRSFTSALALLHSITAQKTDNGEARVLAGESPLFGVHDNAQALADYRKAPALRYDLMAALKKTVPAHPITCFLEAKIACIHEDHEHTRLLTQPLVQGASSNPRVLQLAGAAEFRCTRCRRRRT